jgi:prepilin-type N-terminal cleavage/methylation domain-containing protein
MSASPAMRAEGGYTLPELLVGVAIGLLVAAAASLVVIMAVQTQPRTTERAAQIQQGRVMLETLTRELRQGESVLVATNYQVQFLTFVAASSCGSGTTGSAKLCRVTYTCGSTSCNRTETGPSGTGPSTTEVVASGITGPNVFFPGQTPPAEPTYVDVRLVYPQDDGAEAVTLDDGAALRNHFDDTGEAT